MAGNLNRYDEKGKELSPQEVQKHKNTLARRVNNFSLAAPITDKEFDTALDFLFNYLLFDVKSWQPELIKDPTIRQEMPILSSFPLHCKGRGKPIMTKVLDEETGEEEEIPTGHYKGGCRYYEMCPIMRKLEPEQQEELLGKPCRVDQHEGVRLFSAQVKELNISPHETASIIQVAQLVRLLILQRRIDWELAYYDLAYDEVTTINPVTGAKIYQRQVNQLIKEGRAIENSINKLQSQLLATRKDRAQMLQGLRQPEENSLRNILKEALKKEPQKDRENIIEAEFEVQSETSIEVEAHDALD